MVSTGLAFSRATWIRWPEWMVNSLAAAPGPSAATSDRGTKKRRLTGIRTPSGVRRQGARRAGGLARSGVGTAERRWRLEQAGHCEAGDRPRPIIRQPASGRQNGCSEDGPGSLVVRELASEVFPVRVRLLEPRVLTVDEGVVLGIVADESSR